MMTNQVVPSDRAPGKFEAIDAAGNRLPYAYRTEPEAWNALGGPTIIEPIATQPIATQPEIVEIHPETPAETTDHA